MGHKPEPQTHFPKVPKLHRRNGNSSSFYLRKRIPSDLVRLGVYGSQLDFKKSLGTSDHKTAKRLALTLLMEWEEEWEEKRRANQKARPKKRTLPPSNIRPLSSLSDLEKRDFIRRTFVRLERKAEQEGRGYDALDDQVMRDQMLATATEDLAVMAGLTTQYEPYNWDHSTRHALREAGIEVDLKSESAYFPELCKLFKKVHVQSQQRTVKALEGEILDNTDWLSEPEPAAASTQESTINEISIEELCEKYLASKSGRSLSFKWKNKFENQANLVKDFWGADKSISSITPEDAAAIASFLNTVPTNAPKRYKNLSYVEAAKRECAKAQPKTLSPKTQLNHFNGLKAMFSHAEEMEWIRRNPFKLKSVFEILPKASRNPRKPMTSMEMNRIFSSDEFLKQRKPGDGKALEQARFWVPLLCLFHSFRANEACQLLIEDVREEEGMTVICIRPLNDAGDKVKNLKTEASVRRIPLHSELRKMGFLKFLRAQKERGEIVLFPELKATKTGSKNDALGKWFSRLSEKQLKDLPGSTTSKGLHSLRHTFTRAMRDGGVSKELRDILGGWSNPIRKNSESIYGDGFSLQTLAEAIEKVKFPDVDFSRIYAGNK